MKTILAIAAHPDDEALGAAGTLVRHTDNGDEVHILFLADGEGSRGSKDNLSVRRQAAEKAGEIIGAKSVSFDDFPDNKMDTVALLDVAQAVEKIIEKIKPQIIYTHHGGDLNIDHQVTHRAVLTACRPQPNFCVEKIYGFEVLSSTEWSSPDQDGVFRPQHHVDIEKYFDTKHAALTCYDAEMRKFPHSRSYEAVKALAMLRGAQVGLKMAESFTVIRTLEK